jgi:uncharacterized protein
MRIGILSDTHDELARTQVAIALLRSKGAEAIVHGGDLFSAKIVEACAVLPCWFVFGNHDCDVVPTLRKAADDYGAVCLGWGGVIELAGKRVGVVHGHLRTDLRRVLEQQPDYLISGHSHEPVDIWQGSVRRINPGALFRADVFTVALLDLKSGELQMLEVADGLSPGS